METLSSSAIHQVLMRDLSIVCAKLAQATKNPVQTRPGVRKPAGPVKASNNYNINLSPLECIKTFS